MCLDCPVWSNFRPKHSFPAKPLAFLSAPAAAGFSINSFVRSRRRRKRSFLRPDQGPSRHVSGDVVTRRAVAQRRRAKPLTVPASCQTGSSGEQSAIGRFPMEENVVRPLVGLTPFRASAVRRIPQTFPAPCGSFAVLRRLSVGQCLRV